MRTRVGMKRSKAGKQADAGLPVEMYGKEQIAEFLLSNAVDAEDYAEAVAEVRRMGLNPDSIPHEEPGQDMG